MQAKIFFQRLFTNWQTWKKAHFKNKHFWVKNALNKLWTLKYFLWIEAVHVLFIYLFIWEWGLADVRLNSTGNPAVSPLRNVCLFRPAIQMWSRCAAQTKFGMSKHTSQWGHKTNTFSCFFIMWNLSMQPCSILQYCYEMWINKR